MTRDDKGKRGFAHRPLALRRCILELLGRRAMLSVHDLAAAAYSRRGSIRPGWVRNVTTAQLVKVRDALRVLIAKGRIAIVGRYRRWRLFSLVKV